MQERDDSTDPMPSELPPLAISVGPASWSIRALIATIFVAVAAAAAIGAAMLLELDRAALTAVALLLVLPIAPLGVVAAAYVLAPLSRFGRWVANERAAGAPFAVLAFAWIPSVVIALLRAWN